MFDTIPRRLLGIGGLGVLTLTVGILGGTGFLPVSALVDAAGSDYWLVAAVAVVGVALAFGALLSGSERNLVQTETPEPERPIEVPAPGDRFEKTVDSWRFVLPVVGANIRSEVRDRLRAVAVETIVRTDNTPRAEARTAVEEGTWTGDRDASAYLRESDGVLGDLTWSWRERRRVRRTTAVIVEYGRANGGEQR